MMLNTILSYLSQEKSFNYSYSAHHKIITDTSERIFTEDNRRLLQNSLFKVNEKGSDLLRVNGHIEVLGYATEKICFLCKKRGKI